MNLLPIFGAALLLAASSAAQSFVLAQTQGGDTFGARSTGQTFTPGVGTVPDPGTTNPVLLMTEFELYQGNYFSATPSATTWLKIYDGDPQNGGNFVGVSSNAINTVGLTFHTLMHWDFTQVPLLTTIEYWAVMSTTNSPTSIDVAEVSLETANRNLPAPNAYAGGSGLIANIVKHATDVDAKFTVRFFNGILGQFLVSGTGCPSSAGLAALSAQAVPQVGQTFQADFDNLSTFGLSYAVFGLSDTQWGAFPLPLPLSVLVAGSNPSCMIGVSADATTPMNRIGSTASVSLTIPNSPTFAGLILHLQGIQIEASGLSLTPKGTLLVGG